MKLMKYALMLLLQFIGMLLIAYTAFNTIWLSRVIYNICTWILVPAAGLFSAYIVTVKGINNYLTWLAPPLAALMANYLAFFYAPMSAGPYLICALCAIIGAAAGDVTKKTYHK